VDLAGSFSHADQPQAFPIDFCILIEAYSKIDDLQDEHLLFPLKEDFDVRLAGVFGYISKSLLGNSIEGGRCIGRDGFGQIPPLTP